ncbi:V-type ATP synthase subunit D [Candidatus Woesearchaeota archaeon]|nr:V-type ATP synthase subunit D [Candidatus Woesearchaeota archaeon]
MAKVKPTRSELIALKKRIRLAKTGYGLLKRKRDGLILEFFNVLKSAKSVRSELAREYGEASRKINLARALESDLKIKSISLALKERPEVQLDSKNIMGIVVPKVQSSFSEKPLFERGYGFVSGSTKIDEAAVAYERVVQKVLMAAEVEVTLRKLLGEIERTKRKVNALERITIPCMEEDAYRIRLRLEEIERENFARLKLIKQKM